MTYSKIDGLNNPISKLIFGCCNTALIDNTDNAESILDEAYEAGYTTFDTARVYGRSEHVLGNWACSNSLRNEITIITKGCHPDVNSRLNIEELRRDIDASLGELKTDYLDVFLLHRDDEDADIESILGELNDYVNQGVINKIGVSNWTHERIELANNVAKQNGFVEFSISSPQFSLARMIDDPWGGCVSISYDDDAINWYRNHPEIKLFTYSALAHGFLSGKVKGHFSFLYKNRIDWAAVKGYWNKENIRRLRRAELMAKKKGSSVSQISLAWSINSIDKVFSIVTSSSKDRIVENLDSVRIELSKEELKYLELLE